ncbi:MAG: zinc ABC transporter substrate-binding protein [Methylibium sp.]|nr:zinc ABC transporter substrate-binding protein [Methylibium sp.]MBA3623711.1 zinc ABC transporter substrate-binding protein [Methylibium sp.]
MQSTRIACAWKDWEGAVRAAWGRLLRAGLAFLFMLSLAMLGQALAPASAQAASSTDKPVAVATISILADFVRAVAGDVLVVESVVHVGGDPHTYEPVPSDARRLAGAAIVFRNGLGLERWLDKLIGTSSTSRPVVTLTEGIASLRVEAGSYAGSPDPHAWMDPLLAVQYVGVVERSLSTQYPQHAASFAANAARYRAELAALDAEIMAFLAPVPEARRRLVTTHDSFSYFSKRYGLKLVVSIWGISTDTEPSAREIARIIEQVRNSGVPAVFTETTVNPKLMKRIAADAKVQLGDPLYGDSVGAPGSGADTYITMMRANARAIARGLEEQR